MIIHLDPQLQLMAAIFLGAVVGLFGMSVDIAIHLRLIYVKLRGDYDEP